MRGKSLNRIWQATATQRVALHEVSRIVWRRRRIELLALATILAIGTAMYTLDSPHKIINKDTQNTATVGNTTPNESTTATVGTDPTQSNEPAAAKTDNTASSSPSTNISTNVNVSTNMTANSQANVSINGQNITLPSNGSISKNISTPSSHTHISASVSGDDENGSSSVNVQVNSTSEGSTSQSSP